MELFDLTKIQLEIDSKLNALVNEEKKLNEELETQLLNLLNQTNVVKKYSASIDKNVDSKQQENLSPAFESIQQNTKKLEFQIDDCQQLSEHLSGIVRQLDMKQMRVKKALNCTEDVLFLKESKFKLINAIETNNLSVAVNILRHVHEIDKKVAESSEDFFLITEKETEVKELVRKEFQNSITDSNTNAVMELCPLLQTLGLETEARENFLSFMEEKVFIAVSADASTNLDGTTDPSTAYAQALSGVFNSTYLILQQYLPMVIQGLENSLGDIHFIRRLHKRCEYEAGIILKRYMKFRNIKEVINSLKLSPSNQSSINQPNQASVHVILDELALLIQYCCKYSKYLRHICHGAEMKTRTKSFSPGELTVFSGSLEFDKMVDELINKYYLEGEQWIIKSGLKNILPKNSEEESKLDECFFVLQKCGFRSLATNNIQASAAVLNFMSELISSDLLQQAIDRLSHSVSKLTTLLQDHVQHYRKTVTPSDINDVNKSSSLSLGIANAMSIIGGGSSGNNTIKISNDIILNDQGGFYIRGYGNSLDHFGVSVYLETLNTIDLVIKYTERLNKELYLNALNVFDVEEDSHSKPSSFHSHKASKGSLHTHLLPTSDGDKLQLCKESFDNSKSGFEKVLRHGIEKLVSVAQGLMKDTLLFTLGKSALYGGINFNEKDTTFDQQPILILLPKILTIPFETIISMCTLSLNDSIKDLIVGLLADCCSEKIEQFIQQTTFSLAGAMKMEEFVRILSSVFTKYSSVPVRGKFSRLKEIMAVLTADSATSAINDNYSHLTIPEIESFFYLRSDFKPNN